MILAELSGLKALVAVSSVSAQAPQSNIDRAITNGLYRRIEKLEKSVAGIWWVPEEAFYQSVHTSLAYAARQARASRLSPFLLVVVDGAQIEIELEYARYGRFSQGTGEILDPRPWIEKLNTIRPIMLVKTAALIRENNSSSAAVALANWEALTTTLEKTRSFGIDTTLAKVLDEIVDEVESVDILSPVALGPLNLLLMSAVWELKNRGWFTP